MSLEGVQIGFDALDVQGNEFAQIATRGEVVARCDPFKTHLESLKLQQALNAVAPEDATSWRNVDWYILRGLLDAAVSQDYLTVDSDDTLPILIVHWVDDQMIFGVYQPELDDIFPVVQSEVFDGEAIFSLALVAFSEYKKKRQEEEIFNLRQVVKRRVIESGDTVCLWWNGQKYTDWTDMFVVVQGNVSQQEKDAELAQLIFNGVIHVPKTATEFPDLSAYTMGVRKAYENLWLKQERFRLACEWAESGADQIPDIKLSEIAPIPFDIQDRLPPREKTYLVDFGNGVPVEVYNRVDIVDAIIATNSKPDESLMPKKTREVREGGQIGRWRNFIRNPENGNGCPQCNEPLKVEHRGGNGHPSSTSVECIRNHRPPAIDKLEKRIDELFHRGDLKTLENMIDTSPRANELRDRYFNH